MAPKPDPTILLQTLLLRAVGGCAAEGDSLFQLEVHLHVPCFVLNKEENEHLTLPRDFGVVLFLE